MFRFSSLIKKIAGFATALTTTFSVGCHMSEPKCYYGPAPMPNNEDEEDLKPEILDDDSDSQANKPKRGNYPSAHSNEVLDVYGPPPMDLDDPDINSDMLNDEVKEPEELNPELNDDSAINDYPKPNDPPVMIALYGVRMETKDK